ATCRAIARALEAWRDPATGERIVARARLRAEVHGAGEPAARAPDVLVELARDDGYSSTVRRSDGRAGPSVWRIPPAEHAGSKAIGMNGTHRPYGLYCRSGPAISAGAGPD